MSCYRKHGTAIAVGSVNQKYMEMKRPIAELKRVRKWAQEKIKEGTEPPWAWYQYMKLIETADAILEGIRSTTTENSLRLVRSLGKPLPEGDSASPQDNSQPRRAELKVPLPM